MDDLFFYFKIFFNFIMSMKDRRSNVRDEVMKVDGEVDGMIELCLLLLLGGMTKQMKNSYGSDDSDKNYK